MSLPLTIHRHPDGRAYLHTWRTGRIYALNNREFMLRACTNLVHRFHCHHRNADGVLVHDSRRGLPAPDGVFDGVYSCHVIEHLEPREAHAYMRELFRVLKPGTICRVSTPDLEYHAREYLTALAGAVNSGSAAADRCYELAVRGLIDQFVRRECGGALLAYFRSEARDMAYSREYFGAVCDEFLPAAERTVLSALEREQVAPPAHRNLRQVWDEFKVRVIARLSRSRARTIGESELWGWDRFSLRTLCLEAGFVDSSVETAASSRLPFWPEHCFDTLRTTGDPIERSLYFEVRKP